MMVAQICNAGFVVRPRFRRLGMGKLLGESYVQNAPLLGYKASVFNLVVSDQPDCVPVDDMGADGYCRYSTRTTQGHWRYGTG